MYRPIETMITCRMLPVKPNTDWSFKLNDYIVSAASRNGNLDSVDLWLWLKYIDRERHGSATGRLYEIARTTRRIAQLTGLSLRTVRRWLDDANDAGYIDLDRPADVIRITGRARLTVDLFRSDLGGQDAKGRKLPIQKIRSLTDTLEVSVKINEIWDPSQQARRSNLLDIVRQRVTERGWCRETFARLVGLDRCSTARLDRESEKRRGWQYASVKIGDIGLTQDESKQFAETYTRYAMSLSGRGQKVWLGATPSGDAALMTQLGVKWDTPFKGRLRHDNDVRELAKATFSREVLGECWSLHPVYTGKDADAKALMGVGAISDSMRQSIWMTIGQVVESMGVGRVLNLRPPINVEEHAVWALSFGRSSESPNPRHSKTSTECKDSTRVNR